MTEQENGENPPNFEESLERLERVVAEMESGETPLSDLVAKFEEGTKLLKICQQRLHEAELKIEQLKRGDEAVSFENYKGEE